MEYSPIDPKTYGVSLPPLSPRRDDPGDENHEQAKETKLASDQTAPSPTSDPAHGSEPENTGEAPNDKAHDARSSPQITAPNPTPTAPSPPRPKRARQWTISKREADREARKKRRRQNIARELGREGDTINSDEEREYWGGLKQASVAEEARRNALSPGERRQEDIQRQARFLKEHIKPRFERGWRNHAKHLSYYPIFVLQSAPPSNNGAMCRLNDCTVAILPDYYHVDCFEELLDLSSPHYLARFECDITKYIPDIGAQYILKEYLRRWKIRLGLLGDDARAASDPASDPTDSERAPENTTPGGEATITNQSDHTTQANAMAPELPPTNHPAENGDEDEWHRADDIWAKIREHRTQRLQVDPDILRVSLGEDDPAVEWDITDYVLPEVNPDYDQRHLLSTALFKWYRDHRIATTDIGTLNEKGLKFREDLGEEVITKIKRYAEVWNPNFQGVFFS